MRELADGFGVEQGQAQSAIQALLPVLAGGLKRNASSAGGLQSLLGALQSGGHQEYLDKPSRLRSPETTTDGNAILGHILGSKDVSRAAASRASQTTGLDSGLLKKMLPVVATMAMGALSKGAASNPQLRSASAAPSGDLLGMLGPMLDVDGDGSPVDGRSQHRQEVLLAERRRHVSTSDCGQPDRLAGGGDFASCRSCFSFCIWGITSSLIVKKFP